MDARKRVTLGVALAVAAIAMVFVARLAFAPSMAVLYSGLDPAASGEVIAALDGRQVPTEVRGNAIFVPADQRDALRLALASEGLPANGPEGFEILTGLSGFGTTDAMFQAAHQRALEGELARTILAFPSVQAARVHISNPRARPYSRSEEPPTASVQVTGRSGGVTAEQARAIRHLVAAAVTGLTPERVTVSDAMAGLVLAAGEAAVGDGTRDPEARAEVLQGKVLAILEPRVGVGHAVVQVTIDANMDREVIRERTIDADGSTPVSQSESETLEESRGSGPSGVTVGSNLPDGDAAQGDSQTQSSRTETSSILNFDYPATEREVVREPGEIRRLSVAVIIDGIRGTAPDGSPSWEPRPDDEIAELGELVRAAVGYDPARGDEVRIVQSQFALEDGVGSPASVPGPLAALATNAAQLIQLGILALVVIVIALFVVRPLLAPPPALPAPEPEADELGYEITPPDELDPEEVPPDARARLRELIAERHDDSAALLRSWIEGPAQQPAGDPAR